MILPRERLRSKSRIPRFFLSFGLSGVLLISAWGVRQYQQELPWPSLGKPVSIRLNPGPFPFELVAYGDMRFTDPAYRDASNPEYRDALVRKIAEAKPAFVLLTGDLVWHGDNQDDWRQYESETKPWRDAGLKILPTLGNHELNGNVRVGLNHYFTVFPDLANSRWYTIRAANLLCIMLDSSLDNAGSDEMKWFRQQLDAIPPDVDFVLLVMHHPPVTHSVGNRWGKGGHKQRPQDHALAEMLEERQKNTHARFLAISGHVHNYERYEEGGVTYLVSGGGGAKPYEVPRRATDFYNQTGPTYHYCTLRIDHNTLHVEMHKLEFQNTRQVWSVADSFELRAAASPATTPAAEFHARSDTMSVSRDRKLR